MLEAAKDATQWARQQAESETEGLVQKMVAGGAKEIKLDTAPFAEKARGGVAAMEADGEWSKGLWETIRALK